MKNINRVFLLGDSWIEGQGTYEKIEGRNALEPNLPFGDGSGTIREWRKNNSWNKFFKKEYGINVINLGAQGANNTQMWGFLNHILLDYKETDLILCGFTSKYRDTAISHGYHERPQQWNTHVPPYKRINNDYNRSLLHNENPLINGQLTFERIQIIEHWLNKNNQDEILMSKAEYYKNEEVSENEKKFSKEFIRDFFVEVFDERTHENIAQINYFFYQKYCKFHNINILFFDLFEPYINPSFVNEYYNVDKSMYITYEEKTFRDLLVDYEFENYNTADIRTIWENENTFPCLGEKLKHQKDGDRYSGPIFHPNQHGYKVLFDYLTKHIGKNYKINNLI